MDKKSKQSLADYILMSFIPFSKEHINLAMNPRKFFWDIEKIQRDYSTSKDTIYSTISRAKKKGYLREIELDNRQKILQLTVKGKYKISKHLSVTNKETWDSKWRILLFDIPEKDRVKRNILRRKLKELNFKQYQLSAWICPFDNTNELEYIIDELNLEDCIQYFIGESIQGEKELKKYFNLN